MNPDYLPLVAEVGAALAGFGGLAGLIGRSNSSESPEVDSARLRGMLQRALIVVVLAMLPMALGQFALSDAVLWNSSAVVFLVAAPFLFCSQLFRLRRLPGYAPGALWMVSGQINLIAVVGLLGAGLLGFVGIAAAYGFALLIELSVAGGQFLRVMGSITNGHE